MAKPNYSFQKRQRELAKKQKKEAKKQQKAQERAKDDAPATDRESPSVPSDPEAA
jgi:hypothetical protein